MPIELKPTERGFIRGEFKDRYDADCSIQESSLATERCIWLGLEHEHIHHVTGEPIGARMHLTQDQCLELAKLLKQFGLHGTF